MKRVAAAVAGLAGLVIVLVVAGCGVGQDTQTDSMAPAVNGALGQAGPIAIRDARFTAPNRGVYPAGSSAELILTIVNSGEADDELVEVTTPIVDDPAGDVEIIGDRKIVARRILQVGAVDPASRPSTRPPTSSVVPTTRPTSSPVSGSQTPRPTSTSAAVPPVELGKATIVLNGLNAPLMSGKTYPVTFVFRNAGSVTIQLPIANSPSARPEPTGESHG